MPAYGTPEPFLGEPRAVPVAADDLPVDPPPRSRERVVWIRELVSRPLVSTSPWVMVTAVLATLIGFVPLAVPGVVLAGRAAVGPRGVRDRGVVPGLLAVRPRLPGGRDRARRVTTLGGQQ